MEGTETLGTIIPITGVENVGNRSRGGIRKSVVAGT